MKIILMSLLLIAAQTDKVRNFIAEDNTVMWQKVYESNAESFTDYLKSSEQISNLQKSGDGSLSLTLDNLKLDYEGAGISKANQPFQIENALVNAKVSVGIKGSRYRVTLSEIQIVKPEVLDEEGNAETTPIEKFSINSSGIFGGRFKGDASKILDHTFDQFFGMKIEEEVDNW